MRFLTQGDKPNFVSVNVRNDEASTIVKGTPLAFTMDGSENGLAAVLPSTAGEAKSHALFAGVTMSSILSSRVGEVQVAGFCNFAVLRRATRAATTDSWASQASLAVGHILGVDTVNNAFSTIAASVAVTAYLPYAVIAESLASVASSASATSDTRTALTAAAKVFLRAM